MSENIYRIFDSVWKLSLVGGYCVLLVILARLLLKKAPKWCSYLLWGIVFVRLCCPILPRTELSLIPAGLLSVGTEMTAGQPAGRGNGNNEAAFDINSKGDAVWWRQDGTEAPNRGTMEDGVARQSDSNVITHDDMQNVSFGTTGAENQTAGAELTTYGTDTVIPGMTDGTSTVLNPGQYPSWFRAFSLVWLVGMLGFLGYHVFSYLRMHHRIHRPDSGVRQVEPGICEIDGGHLSFVMGLVHPVIYLSSGLDSESRRVVLCHERVHLQRRDYLFKPAALVICCVHWFNPLVWLAFYLMNMDCEMSCDEKVVKLLGEESKKVYSYTLLEEASGGEWKRYRGGSICALLSFGEDHVKSRIRHVLDYRKPSFWIVIGAVVVIVALIVSLGSNPGGGSDVTNMTDVTDSGTTKETADSGAETGPEETDVDSAATPEAFASVTIQNRADFSDIFDVEAIEEEHTFAADSGAYELLAGENGIDSAFAVFKALSEGNTAETYTKYTDPVTSAVALLHLGEGSGTVTETLYAAGRQYSFYREDPERPGEGSVVNVHYTFAEDGSSLEIPMVMAEETTQLWFLSFGDPNSAKDLEYGPLNGDICARKVYEEYELRKQERAVYWGFMDCYYAETGSYAAHYPHVQVSSYGIYTMSELAGTAGSVYRPVLAEQIMYNRCAVVCERKALDTSDAYTQLQKDLPDVTEWSGIKVYYLTDPDETHLGTDAWMPTVLREFDLNTRTVTDRALPENLQIGNGLWVGEGYYYIKNSSNPSITIQLPLTGVDSLYAEKSWEELEGAVDGSYAARRGADILAYPGVVFDVSERTEDETFALIDLDGDGVSEKISIHPAEPVKGYSLEEYTKYVNIGLSIMNCYDLREAVLEVNGQSTEFYTENMNNSIFAFSPDGEQILIALYEDGPSADPLTRLYHYENGKLVEAGQIQEDIRHFWIQDGQIAVIEPYWAVQTDSIHRIYRVTATGQLQEVPQEEYALGGWTEVELLQDMTLYRTPDGETFVLPAGSKARMTKLDATQSWICLETADGVEGWFRLETDINYDDYFGGLNYAD